MKVKYQHTNITEEFLELHPYLEVEIMDYLEKRCQDGPPIKHLNGSRCLVFTGNLNPAGYGIVGINRKATHPYRLSGLAHRVAYMIWVGPIPEGMYVLHKCDNPNCINPDHLYLGGKKQNMRNATERRFYSHPHAKSWKLTTAQVKIIRTLLLDGVKQKDIAKLCRVHVNTIRSIKHGYTWKYV